MASVLFTICFLIFVAIMDYPYISRIINEKIQGEVVVNYQSNVENIEQKKKQQMLEDAIDYNKKLATGLSEIGEVSFQNEEIVDEEYENVLAIKDYGVMGIIRIPRIDVSLSIFHGTSEHSLENGSGHLEGSSLPIGGESTHTCLTAHRGLANKKMFTNLDLLENGDVFYIDVLGRTLAYEIYQITVVLPHEVDLIAIEEGEDLATLITCTPYGINSHRLFVQGKRIPYEAQKEPPLSVPTIVFNYWWIVATVLLLIWMVIMLWWFNKENKEIPTEISEEIPREILEETTREMSEEIIREIPEE